MWWYGFLSKLDGTVWSVLWKIPLAGEIYSTIGVSKDTQLYSEVRTKTAVGAFANIY